MRHSRFNVAVVLAVAACGGQMQPGAVGDVNAPVRWIGTLQQTQQRTGVLAPTALQKASGTIQLTEVSTNPDRLRVNLTLSAPANSSSTLRWAILPGRCGSSALPVTGLEQFPLLEVGSNGRAQLGAELGLSLESGGAYHVNVYWGQGQQLNDVLTCGNLRRER